MVTARTLSEFLLRQTNTPFQWGESDCSLMLADWWRHVHGKDPAGWLRGTYSSAEAKDRVVAANRGLQRLVSRIASEAGALRTATPTTGDFGLIAVGGKPFGAICTGRVAGKACWAVRSESGLAFLTNPRFLRAWSINVVDRELELAPKPE